MSEALGSVPSHLMPSTPVSDWTSTDVEAGPAKANKSGTGYDTRGRRAADGHGLGPEARAYRERLDAGLIHIVADISYEIPPWSKCSCGEWFAEGDAESTAKAFNEHSMMANQRARLGRR